MREREEARLVRIGGGCHCGNVRYVLDWPGDPQEMPSRACTCAFCTKHGGRWTSHRDAALAATVDDPSLVSRYRFGIKTADFFVCARCGAVPFVTSAIDGRLYAVVNVNTLEGIDPPARAGTPADFDGEGAGERLERRRQNWIGQVRISGL